MDKLERERRQQAYKIWIAGVIEEKLAKAKTYDELHQVWELTVGTPNPEHLEISKDVSKRLVGIACGFEERLEAFRIAPREYEKIAFERVSELADGFENWFAIWRFASEDSKEKKIAFEEMKKAKGSFGQWREVRQFAYIYDKIRDEKAAFQEMRNLANNLTERCRVWKIRLRISRV